MFAIANLVPSLIFVINLEMPRRLIERAFLIQCDDHTFEDVIVESHILQLVEPFPMLHTKRNESSKWVINMVKRDSPEVDQRLKQLQVEFLVVVAHFPFEHLHLYNACNNIRVDMALVSSSFLLLYSPFWNTNYEDLFDIFRSRLWKIHASSSYLCASSLSSTPSTTSASSTTTSPASATIATVWTLFGFRWPCHWNNIVCNMKWQ